MRASSRSTGERAGQALEPFGQQRAGAAEVQTHEAVAAGAEQPAVVERNTRALEEERIRIVAVDTCAAAVEPRQIRRLRRRQRDAPKPARYLFEEKIAIAFEVAQQLFEPGIGLAIGPDGRGVAAHITRRPEAGA